MRTEANKPNLRGPIWRGLIIGFPMLIVLILISGIISAKRVEALRGKVFDDLEREHLKRLDAVLNLRDIISQAYIQAIQRGPARRINPELPEFKELPEALRVSLEQQLAIIRNTSLADTPEWRQFEVDLQTFLDDVLQPIRVGIHGFKSQNRAIDSLNNVVARLRRERSEIAQVAGLGWERTAQRDIWVTTIISLGLGIIVASLSVREIYLRFRELQNSYRAIAEAREFARTIINSSINAIFTLNDAGEVTSANVAFYRLLNTSRACLGLPYSEVFKSEPKLFGLVEDARADIASRRRYRGRIEISEDPRRVDLYISPLFIDESPQGLIGILVDVTETERAQEEIRRNQALAAIGQITAQVAHEVKNPLGGIKLNLSYLQRNIPKDNEEVQEILGEFSAGIDRLNKIVSELNQFARPRELVLTPLDLNQLLDEQLALVADKLQQQKIAVVKHYQPDLPTVKFDAHELSKAFINLLINAIDASSDGKQIELFTDQQDSRLCVRIVDHGVGMSKETLARLFEPFYSSKTNGTGLGMSIAKRSIEMHGGSLTVKSAKGSGTEVNVLLPINPN
ncbi:MAG: ATP-binding protein [Acidobacteriota bacterium]